MGQSRPLDGAFDQEQIDRMEKAIERAWEIVSYTDCVPADESAKKLLASCVLAEMQYGQKNNIKLVNNAIARFRAGRFRETVQSRKRSG